MRSANDTKDIQKDKIMTMQTSLKVEYREQEIQEALIRSQRKDDTFQYRYLLRSYSKCEYGSPFSFGDPFDPEPHIIEIYSNIPKLLSQKLSTIQPPAVICLGADRIDPYQPCEQKYQLTKKCLEYIRLNKFPVHIITKSALIRRDIELIKEISLIKGNWCYVSFSFSALDPRLSKTFEPLVPNPLDRLAALKEFSDAGINCGIIFKPILPYITDTPEKIKEMFKAASEHGAQYVIDIPLTLSEYHKESFFEFMESSPKLRRYIKRYERLYKVRTAPYGKIMHQINTLCFDNSNAYGISRMMPVFEHDTEDYEEEGEDGQDIPKSTKDDQASEHD